MDLPNFVRVGPFHYPITRDPKVRSDSCYGETDLMLHEIRLADNIAPDQAPVTLLHEFIHAINYDRALPDIEDQVKSLAQGLAAILQDLGWMPREFDGPRSS